MSLESDINSGARDALQEATGTPPDQLRGLTAAATFIRNFAAQQLAATRTVRTETTPTVETTTITFPAPANSKTNEQPMNPDPSGGGKPNAFTVVTARYVDVSGGTPVTATANFLTQ